ncbi:MAG: tRNA 2-selenouridine(34) synthase MnmH [Enterobacterales bacterium]|nr:tRNA 2-selenouridine(34) synthase MnmH [Enterobacterales bacterium]
MKKENIKHKKQRPNTNDYQNILLSGSPLIDLRSPSEFQKGAIPGSTNLPLMSDEERRLVGLCYKQKGQQQAIELGHQLVQGETQQQRVSAWKQFAQAHDQDAYFYCFRGGLRSRISQQWLAEQGNHLPIIEGGYKALRRFLIDQSQAIVAKLPIYILGGYTGTAKTRLLQNFDSAIDLEKLANHRGSSFGKMISPQPTQIDFENQLALKLMQHQAADYPFLLLEDEGRLIGSRALPLDLKQKMEQAEVIMIEESLDFRINQIYKDYVVELNLLFNQSYKQDPITHYETFLVEATNKIKKRLGGEDHKKMLYLIDAGIRSQRQANDLTKHKDWIVYLLKKYYDPMYQFQLKKKQEKIIFKGDYGQVQQYLCQLKSFEV